MLSGLDLEILGLWSHGEVYCMSCASKKLGSLRAERLRVGLETDNSWGGWIPALRWSVNDQAIENGYTAKDGSHSDTLLDSEAHVYCSGCGKKLNDE
jgi:hypothetical protein